MAVQSAAAGLRRVGISCGRRAHDRRTRNGWAQRTGGLLQALPHGICTTHGQSVRPVERLETRIQRARRSDDPLVAA